MCYMRHDVTDDVNVRELRQNISKYLRRVLQGERLRVLSRGRPVAILGPLTDGSGVVARLVAEGRLAPARGTVDELGPPPEAGRGMAISDALEEQRSR
jgi:prevent-host-death family protein